MSCCAVLIVISEGIMTSIWSIALLAVLAPVLLTSGQHDMQQLEHRSVIAQMFEWRFEDIAFECEQHLGPKGYAAVQVWFVRSAISCRAR